jgi:predicted transcriptional regulator
MSDWKGVAITLVVASIVAVLGAQMVGLGDQLQERQTEIKTHGAEVYHNQTIVVSSDDCYETCGMTADSINRRQRAILITLDQREVWVSGYTLGESVPGHSVDQAMQSLIANGVVERRNQTIRTEYRYVGPDDTYSNGLSDAELRQWVADQLYAYQSWYTMDELASSFPASESRVASAVHELKSNGTVQQAQEGEGGIIVTHHTAYAHQSVDEKPYQGGPTGTGMIGVFVVIVLATLVIGVVQRFRTE